ncbi:hypothetical protein MCOR25_003982 [Pyricularia grisea]|nr:hypothetical protein MCOR25_003982 [Pyricularia grisea]
MLYSPHSKSKRSSDKREHSSHSNETEAEYYEYEETPPAHSGQYSEAYEDPTYTTHTDYEGHAGGPGMTPRTTHSKDEDLSTSYEFEGAHDAGPHEPTEALSKMAISNETAYADGNEAQGDEFYDDQYGSTSKGKNKETAGEEEEHDYEEPAELEAHTKPSKQVTFGETNDYEGHQYDGYQAEDYDTGREASKREYYSMDTVGESSTAAINTYQEVDDVLANAPKGPRISGSKQPRIVDSRFLRYDSSAFQPGNVFKTVWADPMGAPSGHFTSFVTAHQKGKEIHVSTRRFIIVGNTDNQSYCVPIFTYGKQGCRKNGVKANRHGMVYSGDVPPAPLKNEPELGHYPVRVYMGQGNQDLLDESRVNYSILCTVQHNVKAMFIGSITPDDLENIVQPAVFSILNGARDKSSKSSKSSKERRKGK